MGREAPKLSMILVAAAFALSCFGFTLFVWKSFGGPTPFAAQGYQIHVLFGSEASQLSPNADVRISGVNVGKVISVERRGLGADALLEIDKQFAPVPSDARAILRFKTLLGETFVEMTPGSPDAEPIQEGDTLAEANVADVQQVDVVLGSFDEPTQEAFKKFLQDTADALKNRGTDINVGIGNLAPTSESAADLLEVLDEQQEPLTALIRDGGAALRAIGSRPEELQSLVTAGNDVFAATAARNTAITRTVQAFPDFLRDTRGALEDIDEAAQVAQPTLRALRPVIPLFGPALRQINRLAPELNRTFEALRPVIDASRSGLPALTRILNTAQTSVKILDVAGRELIPIADYLRFMRSEIIPAAAKTGAAVQGVLPDGTHRYLRTIVPINDESIVGVQQRLGSNRHNAYPRPGALRKLGTPEGLEAYSCRNVGNPQTIPVIGTAISGCVEMQPYRFRGLTQKFPHVRLAD